MRELSASSTLSCTELIISTKTDEDMAPDRRPGRCLCLCLCFEGQQEPSVREERRGKGGMLGGVGVGVKDMGG